ncbi:MAG: hypothetical protein V2J10_06030, partial [Wenzhouxiangella sp.]|nr:hypothetical protein [Wenzhouxiangella sp.]
LSPFAAAVLIGLLLFAGGMVFVIKPDLFNQWVQVGGFETLDTTRVLPELEEDLKLHARSALLRELADRGATQAEFDAVGTVDIESFRADPLGYYRREMDFWRDRGTRRVDYHLTFNAGGSTREATGSFTVSGRSNRMTFTDLRLLPEAP